MSIHPRRNTKDYEGWEDDDPDLPIPPPGSPEAFAAVERLTTLLADLNIPNLEEVLADPMIRLENACFINEEY